MTITVPYTSAPGILVPALPGPAGSELLALLYQLEQSEFWPGTARDTLQKVQLSAFLSHAWKQVPFYREHLQLTGWKPETMITWQQFRQLPVLTRADAMQAGDSLKAVSIPQGHGEVDSGSTSGSTGRSLRYWSTGVARQLHKAMHLRRTLQHGWELSADVAGILVDKERVASAPDGKTYANWGSWIAPVYPTGKYHFLSVRTDIAEQLRWLNRHKPRYLHTYPSNLMALLRFASDKGYSLNFLRGINTLGELVTQELREKVVEQFGWPLIDVYSSQEVGYIATQCTEHEHYHVQDDNVVLEVLNEDGNPCRPGEVGRVIVTPLHNFAFPLIRYELGDYAEVGGVCDCGRTSPVLKRVIGRVRNMLKHPEGRNVWPHFGTGKLHRIAPIKQFQLLQTGSTTVELRLVLEQPLSATQESQVVQVLQNELEYPFEVVISYHDKIERSEGGKYEDFICQV